ncbi:hypothetical protein NL108_014566 [Boleophthalmus pectinirostris]|nr:hypothetical protein NL108_014566 [Boleophthalmus pectinirostris]
MKPMLLLPTALVAALLSSVGSMTIPGPVPYHAFCRSIWLFATPCAKISTVLEKQIVALSPEVGCADLIPLTILANHTSADGLTAEILCFKFMDTVLTGSCIVYAESQSLNFSKLLDTGINYCNLYNLVTASGLTSQPDFMEMTNEWACPGYGLAMCKV